MTKKQPDQDFVWPEFNSDKERIKYNTNKYKNLSITEAFNQAYGVKLKENLFADTTPQDLKVGDEAMVNITSINKDNMLLEVRNFKKTLSSKTNLWKYKKFKEFIPVGPVRMSVMSVTKDNVVVDPIAPLLVDYIDPRVKNPRMQCNISNPQPIIVKNLTLTKGGFMGKAVIPNVSEFVGEDYEMEAFIPGSQIVLNITDNFEKFNGATVQAFVVNYIKSPTNPNKMSLICSAKDYIKFIGECNMVNIFKEWCEESDKWKGVLNHTWKGKVTGVINTSKKCGVFVEIPELCITGMVETKPSELVNYKPHQDIDVKLVGFEEDTYYNHTMQQLQHADPYVIKDDILEKCNLKPVLKFL